MKAGVRVIGVIVALLASVAAAVAAYRFFRVDAELARRMEGIVAGGATSAVPCMVSDGEKPLVLLALGQSNAANHGALGAGSDSRRMVVFSGAGKCQSLLDPLPGGTGRGGSIWSRLPAFLDQTPQRRPVVLAVLAVDASSIDDWTRTGSPLRKRLEALVVELLASGLKPDLVLWQHGETDARLGIDAAAYRDGMLSLASILEQSGSKAPIMTATSTYCREDAGPAVRGALEELARSRSRFLAGPDTDLLQGPVLRFDGCHFAGPGLAAAAGLWAQSISSATWP